MKGETCHYKIFQCATKQSIDVWIQQLYFEKKFRGLLFLTNEHKESEQKKRRHFSGHIRAISCFPSSTVLFARLYHAAIELHGAICIVARAGGAHRDVGICECKWHTSSLWDFGAINTWIFCLAMSLSVCVVYTVHVSVSVSDWISLYVWLCLCNVYVNVCVCRCIVHLSVFRCIGDLYECYVHSALFGSCTVI